MNKNLSKTLENPLILILVTILTILALISLRQSYQKANLAKQNLRQTKEKLAQMEKKVDQKEEQLELAKEDLYKEKIIRNELLQQKEGELILQIPLRDNDLMLNEEKEPAIAKKSPKNNRQAWLSLLFE